MKGYVLEYVNENEFKKLERALKKYNMLAFKKLNFDYYPSLRNGNFVGEKVSVNKQNGTESYELRLPSDKMFAQIHGEVKLKYTVHKKEGTVVLETITPTEILLEGHRSELTTYKGIMISKANASKDKFKIDLLSRMQIFIVFALLLALVGGATYAYFTAQGGGTSQANVNVLTHTTDSLIFETGVPISFYADQENFAQGKPNRFGSTIARATAKAGSATEKFVGKYNIFFVIEDNDFEYTTTEKTAELILTIKDPTGTEVTSLPNLTHTTVKGVSGFDITMKKGAFAIVKEQVIEALTSQTTVQEWEITVTLINLDSNQNANTKKTFNAQLYVTKEDMESYALPVVNTIETTVGGSGTELQVKAKTGASTAEVKKYYYKIDETTSTAQLKVKALKVTPLAIGAYEESDSDTHTFTGLTAGKDYKVSIYTKDANGFKSSVYTEDVSTGSYVLPKITSVDASTGATNFSLTVNTTAGDNAISKYFYKVEGVDTKYQESTSNKKDYTDLTTGETYTVSVYAQDSNGRNSYVYSINVTPEKPSGTNAVEFIIDLAGTVQGTNNLYHHNSTLTNGANDNSYRYAGSYETTNNWVCFGQDDVTGTYAEGWCDDEHLYRIIGVFDSVVIGEDGNSTGATEPRVKLIKAYEGTASSLGKAPNESSTSLKASTYYKGKLTTIPGYYWSGSSSNTSQDWKASTLNTSILNGTYLTILNKDGNNWTNKIATTEWKIGGNTGTNIKNQIPSKAYQNEVVNPSTKTVKNPKYNAKIGLMYASDYGFASISDNWNTILSSYSNDTNRKNNWLFIGIYEWAISPYLDYSSRVYGLDYNGHVFDFYVPSARCVRPSFSLISSTNITGGSGTEKDPYRIA